MMISMYVFMHQYLKSSNIYVNIVRVFKNSLIIIFIGEILILIARRINMDGDNPHITPPHP